MIYSFFILLVNYLDGERAIIEMLRGRLRMHHLWPMNYFYDPIDVIDSKLMHLDVRSKSISQNSTGCFAIRCPQTSFIYINHVVEMAGYV